MKRLVEGSLSPRAASLLRSAATDVPPRAAEEKARLVTAVASSMTAPGAGRPLSSGKWLGVVSLAVIVTAGALAAGYRLSTASSASTLPVSTSNPETRLAPAEPNVGDDAIAVAAPAPAPPKSVDVMDLPSAPVRASGGTRALAAPSAITAPEARPTPSSADRSAAGTPSLEDELRAVDEARAAFVDNNPTLALERVDSYRRRFPSGRFLDEAEALEIQSLVALGRSEEARLRADRFLATRPASPYAQRVRSAVGIKK